MYLGFSQSNNPLALLLGQNPGAVRAADYTSGLYYSAGVKTLVEFMTDARATEIILPDANGKLVTIPAGEVSRTTKGLGVYGAATQILEQPLDVSDAYWTALGVVLAAIVEDNPLSLDNVYELTNNTGTSGHGIYKTVVLGTGATLGVIAAPGTSNFIGITNTSSTSSYSGAVFDLSDGTVTKETGCDAVALPLSNGYYLCLVQNTTVASGFCVVSVREEGASHPWGSYAGTGKFIKIACANMFALPFEKGVVPYFGTRDATEPKGVQGRGPELAPNTTFDDLTNVTEAFNATNSSVSGELVVSAVAANGNGTFAGQGFATVIGSTYAVGVDLVAKNSTAITRIVNDPAAPWFSLTSVNHTGDAGRKDLTFVATATTTYVLLGGFSGVGSESYTYDNLSITQLTPYITTQTHKIEWDADGVTGDRSLYSVVDNADTGNRVELHFVSGSLRFESYDGGVSQSFVAVPGVDDGDAHSAVIFWDEAANTIKAKIDNGNIVTDATVTIPTTLNQIRPGWGPAGYAQGFITQEFAAPGDMTGVWS